MDNVDDMGDWFEDAPFDEAMKNFEELGPEATTGPGSFGTFERGAPDTYSSETVPLAAASASVVMHVSSVPALA